MTSNSKVGLDENFEASIGNLLITTVISSVTFSKEINNSFTGAISLLGNFNLFSQVDELEDRFGWGFMPRITFGDKFKNTTIGFIGYQLPVLPEIRTLSQSFVYGGYFGSQKKIAERFSIAGETLGLSSDGFSYVFLTNVIINYMRNSRENWSFGITLISSNNTDLLTITGTSNGDIIPLPYIGIQRNF